MTANILVVVIYGVIFFIFLTFWELFNKAAFFDQSAKNFYFNFYTFIEFLSFSLIYFLNVKAKIFRRFNLAIFLFFVIFEIAYFFKVEVKAMDSIPIGIETVVIFAYIFYFFYEYFMTVSSEYVYDSFCFWISIGIMLYLGSSFFVYILSEHLGEDDRSRFMNLSYIMETVKNILFSVAIVVATRQNSKQKIPMQNVPYLDFN
jgi:hypothetical protein